MSVDVNSEKSKGTVWEFVRVILLAVLIAVLVRIFLFQPFNIPSASMKPTLLIGDYLFVSKYSYGYTKYSFPMSLNLFDGRIAGSEPSRGDVAVFKLPSDNATDDIKRVVGLPGERIQMRDGQLYINGEAVQRRRIEDFELVDSFGRTRSVSRYIETLPNGVSYETLDLVESGPGDNTEVFTVPAGHYFMMGDNRDNSVDSRFFGSRGVGFVPLDNFIGRAEITFFSIGEGATLLEFWRWPLEIRWSRLFGLIR